MSLKVWIDGKLVGEKTDADKNNMSVSLPPSDGERTVNVFIEASAPGAQAGLGGPVTVK